MDFTDRDTCEGRGSMVVKDDDDCKWLDLKVWIQLGVCPSHKTAQRLRKLFCKI